MYRPRHRENVGDVISNVQQTNRVAVAGYDRIFFVGYASTLINYITAEEIAAVQDSNIAVKGIGPKDLQYLQTRKTFLLYCGARPEQPPLPNWKADYAEIPEAVFDEETYSQLVQQFGSNTTDPLGMSSVPFPLSIVYRVRLNIAEWQMDRYDECVEAAKATELRILLYKKQLAAGEGDVHIEKLIEAHEKRLMELKYKRERLEKNTVWFKAVLSGESHMFDNDQNFNLAEKLIKNYMAKLTQNPVLVHDDELIHETLEAAAVVLPYFRMMGADSVQQVLYDEYPQVGLRLIRSITKLASFILDGKRRTVSTGQWSVLLVSYIGRYPLYQASRANRFLGSRLLAAACNRSGQVRQMGTAHQTYTPDRRLLSYTDHELLAR
ncbi:hypothetical protein N5V81_13870 [Escherichia coli]|nr:hypothetical protein [Escherichia coli]